MCWTAATAAVGAASALVSFAGQRATYQQQETQWEQNQVNALAADRDTQNQLTERQLQEQALTSQKLQGSQLDQARRQAEAEASGASSGIGNSISLDDMVNSIGQRSEENRAAIMTNWNDTAEQFQTEKDAANDTYLSRVNSVNPGTPPNPLTPFLGVASAGLTFGTTQTQANTGANDPGIADEALTYPIFPKASSGSDEGPGGLGKLTGVPSPWLESPISQ
jgi:hypothetical protein